MSGAIKFGTDGWRAVIADEFTFENVRIATNAIGKYILTTTEKLNPIIIGYDNRFASVEFAKVCALELESLGIKTIISDSTLPTPVIAFHAAKSKFKTCGGIQFTASHNPPKYCGLKYITSYGGPAPEETTNSVVKNLNYKIKISKESDFSFNWFNPKEDYFKHIESLVDFEIISKANIKVSYDSLYGVGQGYLDYLLKKSGCTTSTIHDEKDPTFGGLLPEPKEEYLDELKGLVKSSGSIVGLATDGDADRLGAIDESGVYYPPNKIASMLLRHLVKNKKLKGKVVRTLSTTHLMDHLAKAYGLEHTETKVGFKWIAEVMQKDDVLIAAEESGGISIKGHVPDKDAVLAGMLLVEMLAFEKKTLKEVYEETLKDSKWSCINDRFDLHIHGKNREALIKKLSSGAIKEINNQKVITINTEEGIKYIFEDDSWFFARPSGTEPMARVYFEATSKEMLDAMKKDVKAIVDKVNA